MTQRRVLLITPYSPLRTHDHAAQDLAGPFATHLAKHVDLHVFAADDSTDGAVELTDGVWATMHGSPGAAPWRAVDRLHSYPDRLRREWGDHHTRRVLAVARDIRPDVVHAEYLQPSEALLRTHGSAKTVTLHDITARTVSDEAHQRQGLRRLYTSWEAWQLARLERRLAAAVDHTFVFNDRDQRALASNRGSSVVNLGVGPPSASWLGLQNGIMLFAGAMWRSQNSMIASWLATEVLPSVRASLPHVTLRIVGAKPTEDVVRLSALDGVEIVGRVPDLDQEFIRAQVILAPSIVRAGVLLKSLRPMSLGCPVVMNGNSAGPVSGLIPGRHALVDDSALGYARHVTALLTDDSLARSIGRSAAELISARYSWENCVREYVRVFESFGA